MSSILKCQINIPSYSLEDTLKIWLLVKGLQVTEEEIMLLKAVSVGL